MYTSDTDKIMRYTDEVSDRAHRPRASTRSEAILLVPGRMHSRQTPLHRASVPSAASAAPTISPNFFSFTRSMHLPLRRGARFQIRVLTYALPCVCFFCRARSRSCASGRSISGPFRASNRTRACQTRTGSTPVRPLPPFYTWIVTAGARREREQKRGSQPRPLFAGNLNA